MSNEAVSHTTTTMTLLDSQNTFKRWITINDPWQPDLSLLHLFGSLPDMYGKFNTASRRQVRCSPQLAAFIQNHTFYKPKSSVPDPEAALRHLLKVCFVAENMMFKDAYSAYQLLCSSQLIIDMAFVRAVLTASAWLGPDAMPAGYIPTWPPPECDTGL